MADLSPGTVFAGHRIQAVAGRGGMGVVYRATQLDLERTVALKVIAPALAEDGDFRARFVRESRMAASIDHPNVIPIYYAGEHESVLYIAMRYVEGEDLRALLRREGALEPGRAAQLVSQVAAALDAAHARGMVHRDVKPANVLLGGADHAYLTDFGLTKSIGSQTGLSHAGQWVGTLGYVSPEQIRGEQIDARADVYALGCLLFYALTGTTPYRRDSDEAALWAHLNDPPPSPREIVTGVPESFDAVVSRAMAKDPADRFPSAGDLGRAALAAAGRITAPPPERRVATGAAAPPGDAPTVVSPEDTPTERADAGGVAVAGGGAAGGRSAGPAGADTDAVPTARVARPGGRRLNARLAALVAVPLVVVAALIAILVATGGGGHGSGRADAPARPAREVARVPVGTRPNAVVVTNDYAYAASGIDGRVAAVAPGDEVPAFELEVGSGATALSTGYGALWVVKQSTNGLLRYSLKTKKRLGAPIDLPPGVPFAVAAGEHAVWVGSRSGLGRNRFVPHSVTQIDRGTGAIVHIDPIAGGVQDLDVGYGAVWIANRRSTTITRLDVAKHTQRRIAIGGRPSAIAVGAGAVWATIPNLNRLVRVDVATGHYVAMSVGAQPKGIATGDGVVWVSNEGDSTIMRVDPRTMERVGPAVRVGLNPKALAVHGSTVWVADVGEDALSRVDF